jgi:competence ComEA-like helix-hairpin-helix protein
MRHCVSWITRPPGGGRVLMCVSATFLVSVCAGLAQNLTLPAIDKSKEKAALMAASHLDDNPADIQAVLQVCTQCHSSSQFLGKPRTASGWEQIYGQMARNGARPTNEQIDQIVRYFQRNLTLVDVNSATAEELAATLQVGTDTASTIVMRRSKKPFTSIDDLAHIKGIDDHILARLKDRLQF